MVWFCIGCLGLRLWGGEPTPSDADATWKELLAARESFYESRPPSLEKKEFDGFLKGYAEQAG
jgi:hypothetical protein